MKTSMESALNLLMSMIGLNSQLFDFESMVIFGDSISDDGFSVTGDKHGFKRFCSGPNWAEYLQDYLGLRRIENYAYSGAHSNYGSYNPFNWSGGLWQLEQYLKEHGDMVPSKTLVAIQTMGINDLWGKENSNTTIATPTEVADNFYTTASKLAEKGAEHIFVFNVMDFGPCPGVRNDADFRAKMTPFVKELNEFILKRVETLQENFPQTKVYLSDIEKLFFDVEKTGKLKMDPPFDHHENSTQPMDSFDYAFFDEYHPSTIVHNYMAMEAYRTLSWAIHNRKVPNLGQAGAMGKSGGKGEPRSKDDDDDDVAVIKGLLIFMAVVVTLLSILLCVLLIVLVIRMKQSKNRPVADVQMARSTGM